MLSDKINEKLVEIQLLEEKLKAARIYVEALRDAFSLVTGEAVAPKEVTPPLPPPSPPETVLRSTSTVALVRDAILEANRPMQVDELIDKIGKPAGRISRQALSSAVSRYVRRGEIFTRPSPATFGLLALGHTPPDIPPGFDLPSTFGDE